MTRDQIFAKVREVLVDALAADEEDVTPTASLVGNLGAESIDFLDIVFKLEQAFGIKIPQGELFPEGVSQDARFVQDGRVTAEGITAMRARLPHVDFSALEKDPRVANVSKVFTVNTLVGYVERKLSQK